MSMTIDDTEVIRAFKAGDHDAFESIVAEYQLELLRHAQRRVHDAGSAEDLVQETFVRAYRAFDRLSDDSRVRPWLHQILANLCVDEANRRRREHDKTSRATVEVSLRSTGPGPEDQLGLDVDDAALKAALAGLPDSYRDALEQRFVDELGYDEIAQTAGVSETNARARVSRARTAMRRALQGAAAIPMAALVLFRRPGKAALAAPPPDPGSAMAASNAAGSASRFATTFAPAMDAATNLASSAQTTMPLLTKAAVGVGAVAVAALSTGPEAAVERPPAVVIEEAAPIAVDAPVVLEMDATTAQPPPATTAAVEVDTTVPPAVALETGPEAAAVVPGTVATQPIAAATTVPVTQPPTTMAPTTQPPTTLPATTEPVATLPPLTGGSLTSSLTVTPAGPRLDLSGGATLTVAGSSTSGSLSGRIGVEAPDPSGARRLDGFLSVQLDTGTIEIRLAGYGTSSEAPVDGVAPTSMTMSGVYRASGATGQLVTSGSFSGSLSGGTLTLTFTP
jgi:RNA polymerase sigma-70 factor, ECF subfamily